MARHATRFPGQHSRREGAAAEESNLQAFPSPVLWVDGDVREIGSTSDEDSVGAGRNEMNAKGAAAETLDNERASFDLRWGRQDRWPERLSRAARLVGSLEGPSLPARSAAFL